MTIDIRDKSNQADKKATSFTSSHKINNSNYYKCFQNYYHGHKYLNPNPIYLTDVKPSVNHWQLRDLIQIDQSNGDLYYTKNDSIRLLKDRSSKSKKHLGAEYFPRCFNHTDNGIVVTGGVITSSSNIFSIDVESITGSSSMRGNRQSKGLFSFYNPSLNFSKTVKLGEMINNSVTVYPYSNSQYKSYVCNNDSNLYFVDINNNGSLSVCNQINCELNTSLNNVAQCPTNNKILTVTGDSSSIFLSDPSLPDGRIKTIKTNHDSGFGISYHPNGNIFATAFQDGACLLYDIRKLSDEEPLIEIKSTRPGHQSGAFRCCKFSHSSLNDLLVISEHVGRVHLIDLRHLTEQNVNDHQVIVFPFALDQFAQYKKERQNIKSKLLDTKNYNFFTRNLDIDEKESSEDKHERISIYGSCDNELKSFNDPTNLQFSAPLVYDYDYLTNINPKLFKDFAYQPPPPTSASQPSYLPPPGFNYPQWNSTHSGNYCNTGVSPTSSQRSSIVDSSHIQPSSHSQTDDPQLEYVYDGLDYSSTTRTSTGTTDSSEYNNYCQDSYQQSVNHIHGEMELSGLDWYNRKLFIGCEDGGLLSWDINAMARRSFGSCSYV